MSQIIVQNAEVLQVHIKEVKAKGDKPAKTYFSAYVFQGGDRPGFYQVNIRDDGDRRETDRQLRCLDQMTRKEPVCLILDEFIWDNKKSYSYIGTLEEMATGKKMLSEPVQAVSKVANV